MIITYCILNPNFFSIAHSYILKVFLFCFESVLNRILSKFHFIQSKYNGPFIPAFTDLCFYIIPVAKVCINGLKKVIHLNHLAGLTD